MVFIIIVTVAAAIIIIIIVTPFSKTSKKELMPIPSTHPSHFSNSYYVTWIHIISNLKIGFPSANLQAYLQEYLHLDFKKPICSPVWAFFWALATWKGYKLEKKTYLF